MVSPSLPVTWAEHWTLCLPSCSCRPLTEPWPSVCSQGGPSWVGSNLATHNTAMVEVIRTLLCSVSHRPVCWCWCSLMLVVVVWMPVELKCVCWHSVLRCWLANLVPGVLCDGWVFVGVVEVDGEREIARENKASHPSLLQQELEMRLCWLPVLMEAFTSVSQHCGNTAEQLQC